MAAICYLHGLCHIPERIKAVKIAPYRLLGRILNTDIDI